MPARSSEYMEEMRERILVATLRCLEREGLANASLSDVCNEAKISRGALYVHFRSKSEILCAVIDRAARLASTRYAFDDAVALRQVLVSELDFSILAPDVHDALYMENELVAAARKDAPLREAIRHFTDARAEQLRHGMRALETSGQLRDGVSTEVAARVTMCFIEGTIAQLLGTPVSAGVHQESVLAVLRGILTPATLRKLAAAR